MPISDNPNDRMRAMDNALQSGTTEDLVQLFDDGMDIDQPDFVGRTALGMCTFLGRVDAVKMLLDRGANVNHVFMFQERIPSTPLDAARESRRSELETLLREHGAKTGREIMPPQED